MTQFEDVYHSCLRAMGYSIPATSPATSNTPRSRTGASEATEVDRLQVLSTLLRAVIHEMAAGNQLNKKEFA